MGQCLGRNFHLTATPTGRAWRTCTSQEFDRLLDDIKTEEYVILCTNILTLLIWDASCWQRLEQSLLNDYKFRYHDDWVRLSSVEHGGANEYRVW